MRCLMLMDDLPKQLKFHVSHQKSLSNRARPSGPDREREAQKLQIFWPNYLENIIIIIIIFYTFTLKNAYLLIKDK